MDMNETHIDELLQLERQKLALQFAAIETRIDDKIKASEHRVVEAVTNAITSAVMDLKRDNMALQAGLTDLRTELKQDILRLEQKLDNQVY
ncbi:hypothetical protein SAMN05660976_00605 [Nonomuraea pusilla]|uniref:Uncharacterized protein n=2 Tax=Nonomuraea pusilla TaxID=46177 RepID=A0A1H7H742_9ACTN|nr:hypothetical protein SAMN05660976_00605 [Nonomuraea pusilla]